MTISRRIIVAITGASGVVYGIEMLRLLRDAGGFETHLVMSPSAVRTLSEETDITLGEVLALAGQTPAARP